VASLPAMDPVPETPEDSESVPLTKAQVRGAEEVRPPLNHRFTGEMPTWIPRLLLTVVVAVFAAYATFMLIRSLRNLLVWLIAALFLSFALEPAVNYLVSRGWRRGSATAFVLLGLGLLGLVTIAAMVPLVIDQFSELVRRSPELLRRASEYTDRWFGIELQGVPDAHDRTVHVLPRLGRPAVPAGGVLGAHATTAT
jgi:predicted PurR-regulated permease PerM